MAPSVAIPGPSWYARVIAASSQCGTRVNRICCCGLFPIGMIKSGLVQFPFLYIFLMFVVTTGHFGKNPSPADLSIWVAGSTALLALGAAGGIQLTLWIIKVVSCGKLKLNFNNQYGIGVLLFAPAVSQQHMVFGVVILMAAKAYSILYELFSATASVERICLQRAVCMLCKVEPREYVTDEPARAPTEQDREDAKHKLTYMNDFAVETMAKEMGIPQAYITRALETESKVPGKPFSGYTSAKMDAAFRARPLEEPQYYAYGPPSYDSGYRPAPAPPAHYPQYPPQQQYPYASEVRHRGAPSEVDPRKMTRAVKAGTSRGRGAGRRPTSRPPVVNPEKYVVHEEHSVLGAVTGHADVRVTAADAERQQEPEEYAEQVYEDDLM